MTTEITTLERPLEVMYLLHKALRAAAARVEAMARQLEMGDGLQPLREAFYGWAAALEHHADMEDRHMTPLLPDALQARENEEAHRSLTQRLEDVQTCLNEEIGRTLVIPRTQRHLYGKVVAARIAQDDHLEEEEAFVLPLVWQRLSEGQQLAIARDLLIDQEAQDKRWHLDWVSGYLTPREQQLLAGFVARLQENPAESLIELDSGWAPAPL